MKKILLNILLLVFITPLLHSQDNGVVALDIPARNSLRYNRFNINPTFSFVRESNKYLAANNKRQWTQFDDNPETYLFSFSGRLNENMGGGIGLFQQNYGVMTTFGGVLNYAYNVIFDRESNLTFGLNAGFYQSKINDGNVVANFPDPSLANIESNSILTINPAINYGFGKIDIGVSVNNAVMYNLNASKMVEDNPEQSFQGHLMYTGYMASSGFLDQSKFSALVISEFRDDDTVLSGLFMLTVPKGIWAQAGYNTLYGISGGLGINITQQISIEYNFEKAIGDLATFGNSHDITLAYKFKNRENYDYTDEDEELALLSTSGTNGRRKAKKSNLTQARKASIAEARKAKAEADIKAQQQAEQDAIVEAEAKALEAERLELAKKQADELAKQEEEARIALEKQKAEEDEIRKREELKIKLANELKEREAEKARLAEEAKQKAEAEERARKLEEAQKREKQQEELARKQAEEAQELAAKKEAQLAEEQRAKEIQEEKERLEREALALAEERARQEAEAQALEEAMVPKDATTKSLMQLAEVTKENDSIQENLLDELKRTVEVKRQDLKDLKEENDLSDKGIYSEPKPFKSLTEENNRLSLLKSKIENNIEVQEERIDELEKVYEERLNLVPDELDVVNLTYKKKIEKLKASQIAAINAKAQLESALSEIEVATDFERKRRIKRAAYDNETDRYNRDRAALTNLVQTTPLASIPHKAEEYDYGEVRKDIQILKNVNNIDSGYYMVIATHSTVEKRDDFLKKVIASGRRDVNFFYDVKTSKYYIYYEKFNDIGRAENAMQNKGSRAYNAKMWMVKIEN